MDGDDGCFGNCTVNSLFDCTSVGNSPSVCRPVCGDGFLVGS